MTDSESQVSRAIANLNVLAEEFYEEMKQIDQKIVDLSVRREELSLLYNQCIGRLRDLEKDLDWVQAD